MTSKRKKLIAKIERLKGVPSPSEVQQQELTKALEALALLPSSPTPQMIRSGSGSKPKKKRNRARVVNGGGALSARQGATPRVLGAASYHAALLQEAKMGNTTEGRAWALKACHPPSSPEGYAGLPDFATAPRNSPEFRTTFDIHYDITMFPTAPSPVSPTYSVQICMPDIPEVAYIYRIRDDQSGVWSSTRVVRTTTFDTLLNPSADTRYLAMLDQGYSKYRCAACSITTCLNAPGLADQGIVYTGQITPEIRHTQETVTLNQAAAGANIAEGSVDVLSYAFPADEKTLMQSCPAYYKAQAKQGAFAVAKFNESLMAPLFHPGGSGLTTLTLGTSPNSIQQPLSNLLVTYGNFEPTDVAASNLAPYTLDSHWVTPSGVGSALNIPVNSIHTGVSEPTGMSSVIIFYIGISNGTGTSAATISTIVNQALDAYVPLNSALVIYAHPAPMWDEMAIRFVAKLHQMLPDGMPADANGFFDFIKSAFSWLSKNSKPITDVIKILPIPGGPLAGEIADAVIGTGNSILNSGL